MASKQEDWTNAWRKRNKKRTQFLNNRSAAKRYVNEETNVNRLIKFIALVRQRIKDLR